MKNMKLSRAKRGIGCTLHLRLPLAVECNAGQVAVILGDDTANVLSARKPPHVALANLRDSSDVKGFVTRWGALLSGKDYFVSNHEARQLFVGPAAQVVQELLKAHPSAPGFVLNTEHLVIQYRDTLRKAWAGNREAVESLQRQVSANANSSWSFNDSRIEINVPDLWTAICILFLNDRGMHKNGVCERAENCPAPYFQKPRTNQRFCGGDCKRWARLEVKRRHWHKKGKK